MELAQEQYNCAAGAAASEIQPQDLDHHGNCSSQAAYQRARVVAPAVPWPKSRQVFRLPYVIPPAASTGDSGFFFFPSTLFGVISVHCQRAATV